MQSTSPPLSLKHQLAKLVPLKLLSFTLQPTCGPRSAADRLESLLAAYAQKHFGARFVPARSLRSIEDFAIVEGGRTTFVDIKTHFIQALGGFSMPNLVSIAKLRHLLEVEDTDLLCLFVDYKRSTSGKVSAVKMEAHYVWEIDWSCLSIGSLGKGQLQIKNANLPIVTTPVGRAAWKTLLYRNARAFHERVLTRTRKEAAIWSRLPTPPETQR